MTLRRVDLPAVPHTGVRRGGSCSGVFLASTHGLVTAVLGTTRPLADPSAAAPSKRVSAPYLTEVMRFRRQGSRTPIIGVRTSPHLSVEFECPRGRLEGYVPSSQAGPEMGKNINEQTNSGEVWCEQVGSESGDPFCSVALSLPRGRTGLPPSPPLFVIVPPPSDWAPCR